MKKFLLRYVNLLTLTFLTLGIVVNILAAPNTYWLKDSFSYLITHSLGRMFFTFYVTIVAFLNLLFLNRGFNLIHKYFPPHKRQLDKAYTLFCFSYLFIIAAAIIPMGLKYHQHAASAMVFFILYPIAMLNTARALKNKFTKFYSLTKWLFIMYILLGAPLLIFVDSWIPIEIFILLILVIWNAYLNLIVLTDKRIKTRFPF